MCDQTRMPSPSHPTRNHRQHRPHLLDLFFQVQHSDAWRALSPSGNAPPWRKRSLFAPLTLGLALLLTVSGGPTSRAANKQELAQDGQPPRQLDIAWHYGSKPPLAMLKIFDIVVVEPDHGHSPDAHRRASRGQSELFAYVSIGELDPGRSYAQHMPTAMLKGRNEIWNSQIIDQSHPDWPRFYVDRVIRPLWEAGYKGFFLDTMDSYQAISATSAERKKQADGLIKAIRLMRRQYPGARLISNRGFELMSELNGEIEAIAAESLYGRWNQETQSYTKVPLEDRAWLTAQFKQMQAMGLPVIAIEYAPPGDLKTARQMADKILTAGFTPYITNGDLTQVGLGAIEVLPRKILMIHNGSKDGDEADTGAQRLAKMPLNYLGYRVDLIDIERSNPPEGVLAGEYAAVVGMFEQDVTSRRAILEQFLTRAADENVPLVFFKGFGVGNGSPLIKRLGLTISNERLKRPIKTEIFNKEMIGYEMEAIPDPNALFLKAPKGSQRLLGLRDANGRNADSTAITPWGGFAIAPFAYLGLTGSSGERWLVDPIEFYRQAIGRNRPIPRADVSTETGRRMLLIHIDGDGFASRAEIPGAPFAAEIMYRDFIKRYPVPHTVSVIEGEVGPQGLYPKLSPTLEKIARSIFKLNHVEIASHSYSHPFFWRTAVANEQQGLFPSNKPHLPLKDYHFKLIRDISGSASYIDRRLAPPGKRTEVFLWTGDCVPAWEAIDATAKAGLLNMNGGDTTITRQEPTLTLVAPFSIRKNGRLQVFAPNQNENVYTNDWTGPFYGFDKVIETFEMTEFPRRLKPINIYYHTYSASKASAMRSLHKVYRYALKQPVNPVYGSQYIRKVIDFEDFTMALDRREVRTGFERWRFAGNGEMRTLRLARDRVDRIDWTLSPGLSGRARGPEGDYLHLNGAQGVFTIATVPAISQSTIIRSTNGQISRFNRQGDTTRFVFNGHVPAIIEIEHGRRCRVKAGTKRLKSRPIRQASSARPVYAYQLSQAAAKRGTAITVSCSN